MKWRGKRREVVIDGRNSSTWVLGQNREKNRKKKRR